MLPENIWFALMLTILAGGATGIGSAISFFVKKFRKSYLTFALGMSAGVMIYISLAELMPSATEGMGFLMANVAFFTGIVFIMLIDFIIPHEYIEEHASRRECPRGHMVDCRLMSAGIFTAIGIAIHNFPEGLAVLVGSLESISLGIPVALAIAIHNIPEGIAVSFPILYATRSRSKAFTYSMLSGLAEPAGAIIGIMILLPFMSPWLLSFMLAFVAGIMVFISFDELLPLCFEKGMCSMENRCKWKAHIPIAGIIFGMLIMAISLIFL
jgi:ZIP family zinc transporter